MEALVGSLLPWSMSTLTPSEVKCSQTITLKPFYSLRVILVVLWQLRFVCIAAIKGWGLTDRRIGGSVRRGQILKVVGGSSSWHLRPSVAVVDGWRPPPPAVQPPPNPHVTLAPVTGAEQEGGAKGAGGAGREGWRSRRPEKVTFQGFFSPSDKAIFQGLTTSLWWTCTRTRRRSCRRRTSRSLTCWTTSGTSWSRRLRLKSTMLKASSSSPLCTEPRRSLLWTVIIKQLWKTKLLQIKLLTFL